MEIVNKLLKIQAELKAPKSQRNDFGKYNYRSCEDILEAVKPLAHREGCVVTISDTIELIGERYYIKATAALLDKDERIENTAFAREEAEKKGMDGSQITGAASSYARKYALNGLFAIDDTKDSDATNIGESKPMQAAPKQAAKINLDPIRADILATGTDEKAMLAFYKVKRLEDMTAAQIENLKAQLRKKKGE